MNFLKSKITFGVVFIIYVALIAVYWEKKGRQAMVRISPYETGSMYPQVLAAVCLIYLVYYFFTYIK
jgi:hypothetical protein